MSIVIFLVLFWPGHRRFDYARDRVVRKAARASDYPPRMKTRLDGRRA